MEKRKNSLSAVRMCRFCLTQNESLRSLYDRNQTSKNSVNLNLKILSCVSMEVYPSDNMPTFICDRCKFFMNLFYEYKQIVRQADETILQYLQHGSPMEIITWPTSLTNVFQSKVVKTVIEGGATVQVTSQDNSDSDDDEGNVYNVKIGDMPDETSTACVKVVTSKDDKDVEDSNTRGKGNFSGEIYQDERALEKGLEDGCWPCDECNCTYPLQQLLDLHKRQKHRVRTVECDQCDAKFFSKYDLAAHQLRHTDEMPFQCIACGKKFKRLILLKRHEKHIHSDLPQQVCPNCPASFLSIEELEAHQKRHIRVQRPYDCSICGKKFHEKSTLQRHKDVVHNKTPTFCCEYCPERFVSIAKLARHVRSHAGDRPYPCKFCDKCFTKSHHYTRHLRLKHRDTVRVRAGPEVETLRCEQCDDTFSSQDDLIYHSAIHATQNLTCPLCQEKFEDVDAVTAHIKTHVNGVEFMCDFCELVFTTKEKLNNHLMKAHEDEMQDDMSHDESSMENQEEDDEDDNEINVKDEGDHMLIEIKKPNEFLIDNTKEVVDKPDITNSEESESETTYAELSTVNTMEILKKDPPIVQEKPAAKPVVVSVKTDPVKIAVAKESKPNDNQTASILRRAEEMKRKVVQQTLDSVVEVKDKPVTKVETTNTGGTSDKSLRLLEKELQDLKRTNSRTEIIKNTPKSLEPIRNKRPQQVHTSTPKLRMTEEKKLPFRNKSPAFDKKQPEKRMITKENKEPRESKEIKNNNGNNKEHKDKDTDKDVKDREIKDKDIKDREIKDKNVKDREIKDKDIKDREIKDKDIKDREIKDKDVRDREIKDKDIKEKETPKSVIKNGSNSDKSNSEEGIRRSTRPSKIKNYAQMIRDRTQVEDNDETSEDDDDYEEPHKSLESRLKSRRSSQTSKPAKQVKQKTPVTATPRKRGRPRKVPIEVPAKIRKESSEEADDSKKEDTTELDDTSINMETEVSNSVNDNNRNVSKILPEQKVTPSDVLVSPTGQTLKKVPIKALPPGVKPLPLPVNARPMATGELCEMQIGKKLVKVQKIVMTKAEVEAMAKKGLVEMKDGTMVLKQGIKLPATDPVAIKSTLVGDSESEKESANKSEKAIPTRCDLGEDS
ncbi:RE1-silencing transcription factor A-like [Melitaea cinxia]|uniref:RE1-silencing transcription factor A-like n=1 Tax=Melitaea cinxia TaxID=113334 RepID=UPI001E274D38|nr:RE1-silencing transcription factor A-like [Melitaea cinxia]